jgi:diacylglycerol O-acyltransferase / wax synthase
MEHPANLMMVTGILMFSRRVDLARLRGVIEERLLAFPRFRQKVVEAPLGLGPPQWLTTRGFDLDAHLHHVAVPAPGDKLALEAFVSDLTSTPLDFSKPLWQFHLVDYGPGSVVVARLHHCIADGMALVRVLLSLADTEPNPPPRASGEMFLEEGFGGLGDLFKAGNALAQAGLGLAQEPGRALDLVGRGALAAATLAEVALMLPDPKTSLKGELGFRKRVAWSEPIDLAGVKAAGAREGATINDVLVSAATGALRRYLRAQGDDVSGLEIRAAVPVNLRPLDEAHKLGNQFGLVLASLPVGIADPRRRLLETKRRMDEIKSSMQPVVAFGLLNALGLTPSRLQSLALDFFGAKSSLVLTNVPGPRQRLYLAGRRLERVMFWVPQSGRLGLGVSILSYAGEVMVGVASDAGLVPEPQRIVAGFEAELARLVEGPRRRPPTRTTASGSK